MAERPILIIDPSCASVHGHHLKSLLDLLVALGPRPATLLVNTRMPRPLGGDEAARDIHRVFNGTVYDEPGLGPRPNERFQRRLWKLRKAALGADAKARHALARTRSAIAPADVTLAATLEDWDWSRWRVKWPELPAALNSAVHAPVAHIIAPSADVELISGLSECREKLAYLCDAQIHARIITPTPALARLADPVMSSPSHRVRHARRMANVHLYVETAAMQRHVGYSYGLSSEVYPYLLAPPALIAPNSDAKHASFGYFGAKRNEKGFKRLLPILAAVADGRRSDDPALSFFVHASDATLEEGEALRRAFSALVGPHLAVEVVTGALNDADYERCFSQIDATLLPYTGARYALSGSGIVCEALALGKAIVMSKGLSFADICHADTAIEADGDAAFGAAILAMARDIERYRGAAAARAVTYADEVRSSALLKRLAE